MLTEEIKKAARDAYEMTGGKTSLEDPTIIPNALGDLLGRDSRILRNQITMAMNSGLGDLFLKQMDHPVPDFRKKTLEMLEDCGLNSESASDICELFVHMTGLSADEEKKPVKSKKVTAKGSLPKEEKGGNTSDEIQAGGETASKKKKGGAASGNKKGVDSSDEDQKEKMPPKSTKQDSRFDRPVPKNLHPTAFYAGWSFFLVGAALMSTPAFVGAAPVCVIGLIILIVFYMGESRSRGQITAVVKGGKGVFTLASPAAYSYGIIINHKWGGFIDRGESSIEIDLQPGKNKYAVVTYPGGYSVANGTLKR